MGVLHSGRLRLTLPPVHVSLAEVQVLHTHSSSFSLPGVTEGCARLCHEQEPLWPFPCRQGFLASANARPARVRC